MRSIRTLFLGGLALVASLTVALAQVNTVPQVGVITAFNTQKQTFATAATIAGASAATDVFLISGSATKTIKVQSITVTGTTTTAAVVSPIDIIRRSTIGSGGTSALLTKVPLDSNNAVATATVSSYTANPTVGTLVGVVGARRILYQLISTAVAVVPSVTDYRDGNLLSQPVTLRGAGQTLAVNLGGAAVNATVDVTVVWTEE